MKNFVYRLCILYITYITHVFMHFKILNIFMVFNTRYIYTHAFIFFFFFFVLGLYMSYKIKSGGVMTLIIYIVCD